MARKYRILIGSSPEMLTALAEKDEFVILGNTVRPFTSLDMDRDPDLNITGNIVVQEAGFVALAYKEE
jgi:hypothetical protein